MNGITKTTYQECSTDAKLDILFDYIQDIHTKNQDKPANCKNRLEALETKKTRDSLGASGLGLLGGFLAMLAYLKFWK